MSELLFPVVDPVALQLGPVAFRWYGLSYVAGYLGLYLAFFYLCKKGFIKSKTDNLDNLIYWVAGLTFLGGRLGEALIYTHALLNPLLFIRVWEGGLSFHGAMLGTFSGFYVWARRNRVDFLRIADGGGLGVWAGIFLGRMANFVNGELYGRVTDSSVPWAMRFPTDPLVPGLLGFRDGMSLRERELTILEADRIGAWERVRHLVPLRHPSQVYEALGEGLLLGCTMWVVYLLTRHKPWKGGAYSVCAVIGYGVIRFVIEYFREPEAQWVTPDNPGGAVLLGMTTGQVLCAAMVVIGAALLAVRHKTAWVERVPPE
ncbi:MAG: prolipoprotein diacylglyceryl transferase [Deltaproteobacteria bacterium]|nr:prolipoprotein diacylglyceryl transferase [Deltaproteobacteria bacterium]